MFNSLPVHIRRSTYCWVICLLAWGLALLVMRLESDDHDLSHCTEVLEEQLHEAETDLEHTFDVIQGMDPIFLPTYLEREQANHRKRGVQLYIFEEEDLALWTNNTVPDIENIDDWSNSGPCLLLGNGWYILRTRDYGTTRLFGLILLKNEYKHENRFLDNRFNPSFSVDDGLSISFTPDQSLRPVENIEGEELFYLDGNATRSQSAFYVGLFFIGLSGLVFFGVFLIHIILFHRMSRIWPSVFATALLLFMPCVTYSGWTIEGLDKFAVFDDKVFSAIEFLPSLAHIFLYALVILASAYALWREVENRANESIIWSVLGLLTVIYYGTTKGVDFMLRSLVRNSELTLDVSDLLNWDFASLLALITIGVLGYSALFLSRILVRLIKNVSNFNALFYFTASLGLLILLSHLLEILDMVKVLWAWALLLVVYVSENLRSKTYRAFGTIACLAILALYSSLALEKELDKKENNFLGLVAERLMENKDVLAEDLFKRAEPEIIADSILWESITDPQRVLDILKQEHLGDYWSKYEMDVRRPSDEEVRAMKMDDKRPLALYPSSGNEPGLNYMMKLSKDSSMSQSVFIGFRLDLFPEELGFLELLQEGSSVIGQALTRYSMAYYNEGRLIDQFGEHRYPLYLDGSFMEAEQPQGRLFKEDDHQHVEFTRGDYTYLISRMAETWMEVFTTFTYILFFLGVLFGLGLLFQHTVIAKGMGPWGLQDKVQVLVVSMVLGSLSIFGIGAYSYIISQNEEKNQRILGEKVDSVLIELSQKVFQEKALEDPDKLEGYLTKFSKVFFSDINVYDLEGRLMASSRAQLFKKGLSSELMNPEAFLEMREGETLFVHDETIGDLSYLSAYVPFMNTEKRTVAYLNLPYFAKQGELENELSEFVVAVVNVLMLLFIISILISVLVSSWLTRPLILLKENLAQIKLGSINRPIAYEGSDEISSLVNAYNTKVQELQENAELLAKSERESAWREMAKQVAHEIKNPLTPMKLSIQYLQRSAGDKGPDWEERFKRSTSMLIEQIDTLSGIATAFSDFAKMPSSNKEKIDLLSVIKHTVGLFESEPSTRIVLNVTLSSPQEVIADKDQMTRLFNNLIKNAVQSIPEEEEGLVEVSMILKGHQYIIEVSDNGRGIPEEMREKIFEPNFTTKSTGTGLGLAMCKNIVELSGGEIWFRTEIEKGTSFLVSLPSYN